MSIQFSGKTTKNFAWEVCFFEKTLSWKDGFTFFNCVAEYKRYAADHNPQFEFELVICNWRIFSFIHYCIWHIDNHNHPYWKSLHVSIHRNKGFRGKHKFKFYVNGNPENVHDFYLPEGFVRIDNTEYFKFIGANSTALESLKSNNIPTVEGNEL